MFKPFILAIAIVGHSASAQTPDATAEATRIADIWLESVQAHDRLPALSAAIVQGENTVLAKGYGTIDTARTRPATADTLYSICSISKLFTAIALMQQWEQGKLRLDDPVTTHLPWAQLKPLEGQSMPITVAGILSHGSGLPRESDFPYWTDPANPFPTQAQLRATTPAQTTLFPANTRFQYSNLGLTLAGETVEAIARKPYASVVQQQILTPLGLADTRSFLPTHLLGTRLAVGWSALKRDGTRDVLPPFDTRGLASAAGFTSSASDLARFAQWQLRLLRTEGRQVLKSSTLREMQRVHFTDPDFKVTRGLGFGIKRRNEQTYVGHSGSCPGYQSILALRPATDTAVTIINTGSESPTPLANAIFDLLDKRKAFSFKAAPAATDLGAYIGRYNGQPWSTEIAVVPWAGGLAMLDLPSRDPVGSLLILTPIAPDRFRVIRADGSEADEVTFTRTAAGAVASYTRFQNPRLRIGDL